MKKVLDVVMAVLLLAGVVYVSFFRLKQTAVVEVQGDAVVAQLPVIVIDPGHGGL